ncbi:MAG: helix-turn-helix transcriptional regulator [Chitinophagaceae bacterium]|nr:helix-turn-helix transcriptional regulator [Chitinophagaceae bacterium]
MSIRLSTGAFNETLLFQKSSQNAPGKSSLKERSYVLNHPAMQADFDEWEFDGFSIRHGKVRLKEDIEITDEDPAGSVVMYFNLSGKSNTFLYDSGQSLSFSGKQHNLIYTPVFRASFRADISDEINDKLEIHISEKNFQRITGDDDHLLHHFRQQLASGKTAQLYKHPAYADAAMNQCVHQLLQTQKKGSLKKIYFESKILELLSLQLEQHQHASNGRHTKIKKADMERLYHAKEILEENIANPCSLIDLAHKVGINDFKLKRGFKALFGNTVFGYLHALRMQKANELLQENELTISEIAAYCGYEYVQHFITAFKKNYGVTPGYFTTRRKEEENDI